MPTRRRIPTGLCAAQCGSQLFLPCPSTINKALVAFSRDSILAHPGYRVPLLHQPNFLGRSAHCCVPDHLSCASTACVVSEGNRAVSCSPSRTRSRKPEEPVLVPGQPSCCAPRIPAVNQHHGRQTYSVCFPGRRGRDGIMAHRCTGILCKSMLTAST